MVSGNNQKCIQTTILNRFWQNNTEKLLNFLVVGFYCDASHA